MKRKKLLSCISLVLALILILPANIITASAAGVETWRNASPVWDHFVLTDCNLTPVKTMGISGDLVIFGRFSPRFEYEPAGCPNIKVTVQIRNSRREIVRHFCQEYYPSASNLYYGNTFFFRLHVEEGEKYQLWFDVSSVGYNPNGNYRQANISYSHYLEP